MRTSKTRRTGAAVMLLLLVSQRLALAHAFLDHAQPKVGASLQTSPSKVQLWFTQDLEPAFSSLKVFSADGTQVDAKDAHVDATEKNRLIVSIPQLAEGTYKVAWRVVSVDTHHTQGDFKFKIGR